MQSQKMRVYQCKQKSNHPCSPQGARLAHQKVALPESLVLQDDITVLACASAMHIPI